MKFRAFEGWRFAVLAVLVSILAGAGCSDRPAQERFKWFEIVGSIIDARRTSGEATYLDVVRVMPFGWEKLYVFPPYTPIDDIGRALGFKWGGAKKTRINERDDITLLVFVIGKTVQASIEHPRNAGDFSRLQPAHAYGPREGYFEVIEEKVDGRSEFYFVEAERYR